MTRSRRLPQRPCVESSMMQVHRVRMFVCSNISAAKERAFTAQRLYDQRAAASKKREEEEEEEEEEKATNKERNRYRPSSSSVAIIHRHRPPSSAVVRRRPSPGQRRRGRQQRPSWQQPSLRRDSSCRSPRRGGSV
ncbi:hypothetical protein LX36DRAFT_362599 [Colletotrichum falcatum]|nr:hypothetical protein LX36DRAFT_362599 [Colletotrichum falcatum]